MNTKSKIGHSHESHSPSDLKSKHNLEPDDLPNVQHFDTYLPHACIQMQLEYPVVVTKVQQQEYVPMSAKPKPAAKSKIKFASVTVSKGSFTQKDASVSVTKSSFNESDGLLDKVPITINIEAVYSGENLVQINFVRGTPVSEDILKVIRFIIPFYPQLSRISVSSSSEEYILYELSKLLPISNLTEVILDNSYLKAPHYDALLKTPGHLTYLSLARCKIDDQIVQNICENLEYPSPASKTLSLLNIACNRISDVGATYIARFLRSNRRLKYLNLSSNWITDEGAEALLNVFKEFALTYEEEEAAVSRHTQYLSKKLDLTMDFLKEIKNCDNPSKLLARKEKDKGKRDKSVGRKRSSINEPETEFYKLAANMANECIGVYSDPFTRNDTTVTKNGIVYANGNNTLCYLNMSFNALTTDTLDLVLKILQYQQTLNKKPIGLLKVCLEGNQMPVKCNEMINIDNIFEMRLTSQNEQGTMTKKAKLH